MYQIKLIKVVKLMKRSLSWAQLNALEIGTPVKLVNKADEDSDHGKITAKQNGTVTVENDFSEYLLDEEFKHTFKIYKEED
jgi:hypothetical protein